MIEMGRRHRPSRILATGHAFLGRPHSGIWAQRRLLIWALAVLLIQALLRVLEPWLFVLVIDPVLATDGASALLPSGTSTPCRSPVTRGLAAAKPSAVCSATAVGFTTSP